MKVLIIEDEKAAAENLKFLLQRIDPGIEVERVIDSVAGGVAYFKGAASAEMVFMDIHLADGISFEIFEKTKVNLPIIFTTAYDEYAIKAFKVNSVDYLLKPIDEIELKDALERYKESSRTGPPANQFQEMLQLLKEDKKVYKGTYLVQQRDTLIPVDVSELAYFTIDEGIVKAFTDENKSYILDKKLEDIEAELNPDQFIRANRQFIVRRNAIENLQLYFNGKLILNIRPTPLEKIVISKARAPHFKKWMGAI